MIRGGLRGKTRLAKWYAPYDVLPPLPSPLSLPVPLSLSPSLCRPPSPPPVPRSLSLSLSALCPTAKKGKP